MFRRTIKNAAILAAGTSAGVGFLVRDKRDPHDDVSVQESMPKPATTQSAPENHPDAREMKKIFSSFLSGSAAGATVAYTLFPFESFKKYSQRRGISLYDLPKYKVMAGHFKAEPFYPFRGSAVFAVNIVPTTAVQLTTDAILQSYLPENSSAKTKAAAAAICGVTGALTATPVENFVARLQSMNATSTVKVSSMTVITDMFRQSVFRPWKSYPMIATRDGIFTFCMLWGAKEASQQAQARFGESKAVDFTSRLGVCVVGAAVSHVPDTIGTNMQVSHASTSAWKTAKQMYAAHGAKGFLYGLPPRLMLFFSFTNAIPYVQKAADPYAKEVANKLLGK